MSWKIAFTDDHPMLLQGMASLFAVDTRFQVVGLGRNASEAVELVRNQRPDILFVDLSMPGEVFGAIAEITREHPATRILVFTAFASVDSAMRALDAGATGFALKSCTFEELVEAIGMIAKGEIYVAPQFASQVFMGMRNRARSTELRQQRQLSVREKQIIGHLMQARTNREIAANLQISEKTVKHYMTALMSKLNARNRVELVIEAQRNSDIS